MSLNQATFNFIQEFEKGIEDGLVYTRKELVQLFKSSPYYQDVFQKHKEEAIAKAIGWAVKRSKNWIMNHGRYVKNSVTHSPQETVPDTQIAFITPVSRKNKMVPFSRKEYIEYLSERLYESLMIKNQLQDEVLRKYHFRSKTIGDELFFVQETFFKEKGWSTQKYKMSDFISGKAKALIESGESLREKLRFYHMVSKHIYFEQMVKATKSGCLTRELVYELLNKYYYICTVTKEEDSKLRKQQMPLDWYKNNPFYRYQLAEILYVQNIFFKDQLD